MARKKTTADLVNERPTAEELALLPRTPISLVVDNVRSLDNVGLLFRLCEVARVEKLYLTGYTGYPEVPGDTRRRDVIDRHARRIEKTAVYALPHQPWEHVQDAVPLVQKLKEEGRHIIALEQTDESIAYNKVPITPLRQGYAGQAVYKLPITLIVGHERRGVGEELLELTDAVVDIPILGLGNSHNVAISTGIVLYHILDKMGRI